MMKSPFANVTTLCAAVAVLGLGGCGYSQEEWDQKVRENESVRAQLSRQEQSRRKCEADYADARNEVDDLRKQLQERGVDMENLSASLEQQKRALEEYSARARQLSALGERLDSLRKKLQKLTEFGLRVDTRDNRMLVRLPGDVLFDSGSATLRKEGRDILLQVAEVVRNDPELSKREFQVAGHTDDKPLKGGAFIDNWGLSAMRARSVVALLADTTANGGGGLDPAKWSAAGYGETDPVAPGSGDASRKKNRRVELVVQPDVEEMLNLGSLAR
jgi:chemotaxis protein MotB